MRLIDAENLMTVTDIREDGTEITYVPYSEIESAPTAYDLDKVVAAVKAAGVFSFTTPEKRVLPDTFGGLQNWFFTGPSGEQIELLQML